MNVNSRVANKLRREASRAKAAVRSGSQAWRDSQPPAGALAAPPAVPPVSARTPPAPGLIDVRELIRTLSVEELATSADDYYTKNLMNAEYYFAKPLTNVDEAPDLLISFAEVLAGLRPLPGMRVLDFGAGTGWSTRYLTQLGYQVVATDVSAAALEVAAQQFERSPVVGHRPDPVFRLFDGHRIDVEDESIDRVFCFDTLHHVPNPDVVLGEMARVLKQGGIAGFSEPGPNHSKNGQSQFEMKNYTVVENDIVMREIDAWARDAGFTKLDVALFNTQSYRLELPAFEDFLGGGPTVAPFSDHVRGFNLDRHIFFLYKGDPDASDSRDRRGLRAAISVDLKVDGAVLRGTCHVENTGQNHWLPSDAPLGAVNVGVHRYDEVGGLLDRDYARIALPSPLGLAPGQATDIAFEIPAPPEGLYRMEFDMVAEMVAWFEINESPTATVDIVIPA